MGLYESFSKGLAIFVDYAWGLPLVFLLMGGGLFLFLRSGFMAFQGFGHGFRLAFGFEKEEKNAPGQISHFGALCNALSSTIGMGNIAGVAVAIQQGGPGALFWMWLSAVVGMCTKFFECSLSVMYRGEDYQGEVQGGPMYVIEKGLGKNWKPLAYFFAFCGFFGVIPLFQINQLSSYMNDQFAVPTYVVGGILAVIIGFILLGGVRSIAWVNTKIVPVMCVFYVIAALVIVFLNIERVPGIFAMIFKQAFQPDAMWGGAAGLGLIYVLQTGVKRAAFSNEAGIGTAPLAHGNAKTKEPIKEGLVAMIGPFLDTIIVCTLTALVILLTIDFTSPELSKLSGVLLTKKAFELNFENYGSLLLGAAVFLFAFSTMLGTANYGVKCWNYLFKGRYGLGEKTFIVVFSSSIVVGSLFSPDDAVNFIDSAFALMAIPSMTATLLLHKKVLVELKAYLLRLKMSKKEKVKIA